MVAVSTGRSLETLTAEDFRTNQGTGFRFTGVSSSEGGSPRSFEAELVEVAEHPASAADAFRTPFSVLFHGPLQPVMSQGIYRLEHERLGGLELFIVPVGPDKPSVPGEGPTAMRYEAVFS
jgi:hypothetical protein